MTAEEVLHQDINDYRDFLRVAERCALRGWPDRKKELRNAFRLQELLLEQQILRLECVATTTADHSSISVILQAVREQWTDAQEQGLMRDNADYATLVHEIESCQRAMNPESIDGPLKDAQRDPDYIKAREVLRQATHDRLESQPVGR